MNHPTTVSEIRCYQACPVKHMLRYVHGIAPREKSYALWFGSYFHNILECHYKGKPVVFKNEDMYAEVIAEELYKLFLKQPPLKIKDVEGVWKKGGWSGRYDGIIEQDGHLALLEHKTTTRTDPGYTDSIWHSQQLMLYCHMLGLEHVVFQVFKYSKTKPRKKETSMSQFRKRVREKEIAIERIPVYISPEKSEQVFREICLWRDKMQADSKTERPSNYSQCVSGFNSRCPYYSLCQSDFSPFILDQEYETRPVNEELL